MARRAQELPLLLQVRDLICRLLVRQRLRGVQRVLRVLQGQLALVDDHRGRRRGIAGGGEGRATKGMWLVITPSTCSEGRRAKGRRTKRRCRWERRGGGGRGGGRGGRGGARGGSAADADAAAGRVELEHAGRREREGHLRTGGWWDGLRLLGFVQRPRGEGRGGRGWGVGCGWGGERGGLFAGVVARGGEGAGKRTSCTLRPNRIMRLNELMRMMSTHPPALAAMWSRMKLSFARLCSEK